MAIIPEATERGPAHAGLHDAGRAPDRAPHAGCWSVQWPSWWRPPWPSSSTTRSSHFLKHPYCQVAPHHCGFYITGPLDGLALRVKIAAYGGLFLASPVLLWELWRFITPGLNPKEKKYAIPFIVASITLFALGCLVAYLTFPHALKFLDSHRRARACTRSTTPPST